MQTNAFFGMFPTAGETPESLAREMRKSESGRYFVITNVVCRTLEQAASVPVVYATAYYSLVVRGRLRFGESVLIHSGSGGVGQAAIAIALSMRCRVFTTVGE